MISFSRVVAVTEVAVVVQVAASRLRHIEIHTSLRDKSYDDRKTLFLKFGERQSSIMNVESLRSKSNLDFDLHIPL